MSITDRKPGSLVSLPDQVSAQQQAGGLLVLLGLGWLIALGAWLRSRRACWLAIAGACQAGLGALLWLFRSPARHPPEGAHLVLAPAGGVVTQLSAVHEQRYLNRAAWRVNIRMSLREVQVNRAPLAGRIGHRCYQPGNGRKSDSNWLGIEQGRGTGVLLRQVAGRFWRGLPPFALRQITCWPDLGDVVEAGQIIGHLPMGDRVELYLPAEATLTARLGQRVRAGETIIAVLPPLAAAT